jgi:DNA-binding transcriptional ArsR family regulator
MLPVAAGVLYADSMKDRLEAGTCSEKLSALAAPDRLRIVQLLRQGPRNVGEVAEALELSVVNASHHLNVLLRAGLVCNQREGRHIVYSLPPGAVQDDGASSVTEHLDLGCCRLQIPKPEAGGPG